MIQVLVATHGIFAEGLCNASKVIMGPVEGLDYIGLTLNDSEYSNVAEPCCPIMRSICNPMARTTLSNQGTTVLIKIASIR